MNMNVAKRLHREFADKNVAAAKKKLAELASSMGVTLVDNPFQSTDEGLMKLTTWNRLLRPLPTESNTR